MAKEKSSRRSPILLLLIVLIAAALWLLRDCFGGLGPGGGPDAGKRDADSPADADSPTKPSATDPQTQVATGTGAEGPIEITVEGDQCKTDGPAQACEALCKSIANAASRGAIIRGAKGAHSVVRELQTCLEESGFEKVSIAIE